MQAWAGKFVKSLKTKPSNYIMNIKAKALSNDDSALLSMQFTNAKKPLLLLDYDGVLVDLQADYAHAVPDENLINLLNNLAQITELVVISGRSRQDLYNWFGKMPINLVAEHGNAMLLANPNRTDKWTVHKTNVTKRWQDVLLPSINKLASEAPGSNVEVKPTSIVWHYNYTTPYIAQKYLVIIKSALKDYVNKNGLEFIKGHKILEIRPKGVNKGTAALELMKKFKPDFMLVAGDDYTDEDMFKALPATVNTIRVGEGITAAKYRLKSSKSVRGFLAKMLDIRTKSRQN